MKPADIFFLIREELLDITKIFKKSVGTGSRKTVIQWSFIRMTREAQMTAEGQMTTD
jgi:hypothetical protein